DGLVGRADDGVTLPVREPARGPIHQGAGLLDGAIGVVDRLRHPVAADREMLEGSLGLRAPIPVGWDVDLAHAVELAARACCLKSDRYVVENVRVISGGTCHPRPPQ